MEEADENEAIVYADIGKSAPERPHSRSVPLSNPRPRDAGDHAPKPPCHDPEAVRRLPRCCQPEELDARNTRFACLQCHCSPSLSCMHDVG